MKSEVYSWRLSSDLKAELEEAARREQTSVARLLDRIAREWLKARPGAAEEEAEQARIRAAAMRFVGKLRSGDPDLAAKASERVREVLEKRRTRARAP
jgi:hypothetical protein